MERTLTLLRIMSLRFLTDPSVSTILRLDWENKDNQEKTIGLSNHNSITTSILKKVFKTIRKLVYALAGIDPGV